MPGGSRYGEHRPTSMIAVALSEFRFGTQFQPPQMGPAARQKNRPWNERSPTYSMNLMGPAGVVMYPSPHAGRLVAPPCSSHTWPVACELEWAPSPSRNIRAIRHIRACQMLRHHTRSRPIRSRFHVPRAAVPAVGMIGHVRHALFPTEPVDQRRRLEDGMMAAPVAPAPYVETMDGHVAEGRVMFVSRAAHGVTLGRSLPQPCASSPSAYKAKGGADATGFNQPRSSPAAGLSAMERDTYCFPVASSTTARMPAHRSVMPIIKSCSAK